MAPDDDLEACAADIDALFEKMRQYELEVAQPALTRNSYYSHFALLACPGFRLRYTNFIEIMAPCLTTALLRQVLDDFSGSMSGFGMDYIWCRLPANPRHKAAIIDEIAIRHTRPVGKALRLHMTKQGQVAENEERILRARYNIQGRIRPLIYAAVDKSGKRYQGCSRLGLIMVWRYLSVYRDFIIQENGRGKPESARGKILQLIRRQVTRKPDLSSLRRVESYEKARPELSGAAAVESRGASL